MFLACDNVKNGKLPGTGYSIITWSPLMVRCTVSLHYYSTSRDTVLVPILQYYFVLYANPATYGGSAPKPVYCTYPRYKYEVFISQYGTVMRQVTGYDAVTGRPGSR